MANRHGLETAMKNAFPAAQVTHKFAYPMTVVSEIEGQKGTRECLPLYYWGHNCCTALMCGSAHNRTVKNAKDIVSSYGAPDSAIMER